MIDEKLREKVRKIIDDYTCQNPEKYDQYDLDSISTGVAEFVQDQRKQAVEEVVLNILDKWAIDESRLKQSVRLRHKSQ